MNTAYSIYANNFDCFEEMAELTKAWELEFYQLSNNQFNSHLAQFISNNLVVSRSKIGCISEHCGYTPSGFRTFALLSYDSTPTIFRGKFADQNTLMCFPEDNTIAASAPSGFDVYTLSINKDYLLNKIYSVTGLEPDELINKHGETLACPEEAINSLRDYYKIFMGQVILASTMNGKLTFPLQLMDFEHKLSELLINCLVKSRRKEKDCLSKKVNQGIATSLEIINDDNIDTPSIECLSAKVGISQRSFENGFMKFYGVTPKKYIKYKNLNRIRRDLLKSEPTEATVIDVANRYGLWHMGQLSKDYKSLFGEVPSKTLSTQL